MKLTEEQYQLFKKNFHISSLKEFSESIFHVPLYVVKNAKYRMIREERTKIFIADAILEKEEKQ